MLQFLRPGMRPWLIAAAVIVCLLGVVQVVTGRRDGAPDDAHEHGDNDEHGHSHNVRVGWLLVLPLCVGLLAPAALDAYSAQRSVAFSQRSWDLGKFDVQKLLSAEAIAGGTPKLALVDYLGATTNAQSRDYLVTHPVRLDGFVVREAAGDGRGFFLTRFFIGCCAADAIPLKLYVQTTQAPAARQRVDPRDGDARSRPGDRRLDRARTGNARFAPRHQEAVRAVRVSVTRQRRVATMKRRFLSRNVP